MITSRNHALERFLRLAFAAFGGYAFAAAAVAFIAAALPVLGMPRSEAATLGGMLGMLFYLAIIIWAVSSTTPLRTAAVIVASAATMFFSAQAMVAN